MVIYDAIYRKLIRRMLPWLKDDALIALKSFRFLDNATDIFVEIATEFLTLSKNLNHFFIEKLGIMIYNYKRIDTEDST